MRKGNRWMSGMSSPGRSGMQGSNRGAGRGRRRRIGRDRSHPTHPPNQTLPPSSPEPLGYAVSEDRGTAAPRRAPHAPHVAPGELTHNQEIATLKAQIAELGSAIRGLQDRIAALTGEPPGPITRAVAKVDERKCIACGECARMCPVGIITVNKTAHVDIDRCVGCGVCATICPEGAIVLREPKE